MFTNIETEKSIFDDLEKLLEEADSYSSTPTSRTSSPESKTVENEASTSPKTSPEGKRFALPLAIPGTKEQPKNETEKATTPPSGSTPVNAGETANKGAETPQSPGRRSAAVLKMLLKEQNSSSSFSDVSRTSNSSPARAQTPRTEQRKAEVVTSEGSRERVAQSPTPGAAKKPVASGPETPLTPKKVERTPSVEQPTAVTPEVPLNSGAKERAKLSLADQELLAKQKALAEAAKTLSSPGRLRPTPTSSRLSGAGIKPADIQKPTDARDGK